MEKYTQLRVLGKGSFGAAWLIQRNSDQVQFVAKEIRQAGLNPAERESAKNEIEVLRTLNHPNITKYIDHFEHRGSLFIVMEFANGGDLYVKIKERRGKLFSEKELLHYFSQICLALGYLHERRILHRDLKTQNVFLTKDGIVKLGDFGISTVLRNTYELKRTVCGTPYYFSPELCLSKPYNNKSDVWALGCILYEMTTLNHAFDGNNMKTLVQKILKGVYPPIHPGYSANLSKLISAMLQIDPHRRPNVGQIIELPFIRDALTELQREVKAARENRQSVVTDEEKRRMQQNALLRREEQQRREQENAARLAEIHQQQRAMQKDTEQQRQQKLLEKQKALEKQQAALLEARKRELDARVREQERRQEEHKAKMNAQQRQKREEQWDKNMQAQLEEERQRREAEQQRRQEARAAHHNGHKTPQDQASTDAAEAYKERQRQAALNKQRAMADMGVTGAPSNGRAAATSSANGDTNGRSGSGSSSSRRQSYQAINLPPDQPPPPRLPPSPHHYSTRKMTQEELGDALAVAYWQMRKEAERNKRRAMGLDVSDDSADPSRAGSVSPAPQPAAPSSRAKNGAVPPAPPAPPAPAAAASSPKTDGAAAVVAPAGLGNGLADADGEEGFRAFINCDAVMEEDPNASEDRRDEDYGALTTVIDKALTVHVKPSGGSEDFDDKAFQDEADPTKFMLDGKTFQLPNVTAADPLMHRIESLRMFLEDKMGDDALLECYRALNSISTDDDERVQKVSEALPADKRRFIPLVMQLIVCEDAFNRQGNAG